VVVEEDEQANADKGPHKLHHELTTHGFIVRLCPPYRPVERQVL
jgi:hypothetical protein